MEENYTNNESAGEDHATERHVAERLVFGVTDTPPLHIVLLHALQTTLSVLPGPMAGAFIVQSAVCGHGDDLLLAELISTMVFMIGVATFLQVTIGVRLPIFQGSSFLYFLTLTAVMQSEQYRCPEPGATPHNFSTADDNNTLGVEGEKIWHSRIGAISGSLAASSVIHLLLGATGAIGFLINYVGPLTIAPTIILIPIFLIPTLNTAASQSWIIAAFTIAVAILSGVGLAEKQVPMPSWNRAQGFHTKRFPLFRIFANSFSLICGWLLSLILTKCGVFPDAPAELGYYARTDARVSSIYTAQWLFFPYPGRLGSPTINIAALVGFIPVIIGSVLESIGDYIATARACGVPDPPKHALNRGILVEGVMSVFSGLVGCCHSTTSYSNFIGFIAFTGVGSRIVWQVAGIVCILGGVFGKIGAALSMVPDPVIGGMMFVSMGMIFSIAICNLEGVDMTTARNQLVMGVACVVGVAIPEYVANPELVLTGDPNTDDILKILFTNGPMLGGMVGFTLDNLLPGSRESRGIVCLKELHSKDPTALDIYDFPGSRLDCCHRFTLLHYIPFLPCYRENVYSCAKCSTCHKDKKSREIFNDNHLTLENGRRRSTQVYVDADSRQNEMTEMTEMKHLN